MSTETRTSAALSASTLQPLFPDVTRDDVFRLETRRLWLRWPRHGDVPALKALASLKEVAEMTSSWPHPLPDGEVEKRIFQARKANATGSSLILALTPRDRPNLQIGTIGVSHSTAPGRKDNLQIGYMLHPDHRGHGLIVEAVQSVLNTVFNYTPTMSVSAWTRVINPASRRVLEKCGFRHTGSVMRDLPARGGVLPCDEFTLDRKTWAALVGWGASAPARSGPVQADAEHVLPAAGPLDPSGGLLSGITLNCA